MPIRVAFGIPPSRFWDAKKRQIPASLTGTLISLENAFAFLA